MLLVRPMTLISDAAIYEEGESDSDLELTLVMAGTDEAVLFYLKTHLRVAISLCISSAEIFLAWAPPSVDCSDDISSFLDRTRYPRTGLVQQVVEAELGEAV